MFSFQVCWVPGKTHLIADALSRAPLFAPEELSSLEIDMAISCLSQTSHPSIDLIYGSIDDYRLVLEDVKNGTSDSSYSRSLKGSPLTMAWIKAHVGTDANEQADQAAKEGAAGGSHIRETQTPIPWQVAKSKIEDYTTAK